MYQSKCENFENEQLFPIYVQHHFHTLTYIWVRSSYKYIERFISYHNRDGILFLHSASLARSWLGWLERRFRACVVPKDAGSSP